MIFKNYIPFLIVLFIPISPHGYAKETKSIPCSTSKEFISTFIYLEKKQMKSFNRTDIQQIAKQCASGCNGATARFINIFEILLFAGATPKDASDAGIAFALKSDIETENFIEIFKATYSDDAFNLALDQSLKIALAASKNLGNKKGGYKSFNKIVKFCISSQKLDLPFNKCSQIAANIYIKYSSQQPEVSEQFIELYEFINSKVGLNVTQSIEISTSLIGGGKNAFTNFKEAYYFALNKTGLNFNKEKAILFAKEIVLLKPEIQENSSFN